jgi:hypothetical protein
VTGLAQDDITRMRDQLFFDGPERNRRLSRFWLLLPLAAVIASAGHAGGLRARRGTCPAGDHLPGGDRIAVGQAGADLRRVAGEVLADDVQAQDRGGRLAFEKELKPCPDEFAGAT